MKRINAWIGASLVVFVVLIVGMRWIGSNSEEAAATPMLRRGAAECPPGTKTCWHGILPGQTNIDQAASTMNADDLFNVDQKSATANYQWCWSSGAGDALRICLGDVGNPISYTRIQAVRIEPLWDTLRLGDTIQIFGQPIQAMMCNPVYTPFGGVRYVQSRSFIGGVVYFQNGISVLAYNPWQPQALELTPDMIVLRILYSPTSPRDDATKVWHGFSTNVHVTGCAG